MPGSMRRAPTYAWFDDTASRANLLRPEGLGGISMEPQPAQLVRAVPLLPHHDVVPRQVDIWGAVESPG